MKRILVSAALIRAPHNHPQSGKFLLTQRQQGVHLAGSWFNYAPILRSALRDYNSLSNRYAYVGFRVSDIVH